VQFNITGMPLPASHDYERLHHVCLSVTNLARTLAFLADREVPVFAGPMQIDRIGQRIAFVRDNVGTVIELTQRVPGSRVSRRCRACSEGDPGSAQ
jgi:catechol 2,3-dioxygenase-like lactoylglutathione lyase family enzyme